MPFNIATNVSFEDENEGGNAVDSKTNNCGNAANAVKSKFIDGHAEQKATGDVALPPTAKYREIWTHLRPDFSC
ncbi:hypothetical protein MAM1_0013c01290 [Mucor ambiguus]|uniref:Uncharacterized protein n=1 Tax=Mucor ambiguus TaxID=91626 RepID=A0A0C9LR14_9FUNG|nr:hypothetical protein MAM1_0013c01290 [Mucor ambiguus]